MSGNIERIKSSIEDTRQQIINHKVYEAIQSVDDIKVFMEYHVYAVWDFMSLLKALQQRLTCVTIPWFPVSNGDTRYLINEIVTGEEFDIDAQGNRKSHFEIYLDAMAQTGASTAGIKHFIQSLRGGTERSKAYEQAGTPVAAQQFVDYTFDTIATKESHIMAAVFTFGREDLIPDMFMSVVGDIYKNEGGAIDIFRYYLERHIEVDGGHHSQLALEMTAQCCCDDSVKWEAAMLATQKALEKRIILWDGVYERIK